MENKNEKKGLFARLTGTKKPKKSACCCNFEVEEIPEEQKDQVDKKTAKDEKGTT